MSSSNVNDSNCMIASLVGGKEQTIATQYPFYRQITRKRFRCLVDRREQYIVPRTLLSSCLLWLLLFWGMEAYAAFNTLSGAAPIVIGHRGASGYRPEHTLAAYELAIKQGADYIEPDLVMTKDRVLIARHEPVLASVNPATGALIEATTNVHELTQFASRKTTRTLDGTRVTGWFAQDFTLTEIKMLKARERLPALRPVNATFLDEKIPTLQEVIDLAKAMSTELGRTIGIYPELKNGTYHSRAGLPLEDTLVKTLAANGLNHAAAPVYIQSFEVANLKYLHSITDVKLVQLINFGGKPYDFIVSGDPRTYADLATAAGLLDIATYAKAAGAHKLHVIPHNPNGTLGAATSFVADAHAAGLEVHLWTFRAESSFLPQGFKSTLPAQLGNLRGELAAYLAIGIDGFFIDHPDIGVNAVAAMRY